MKVEIRADNAVAAIDPSLGASLVAFTVEEKQITRRAIGVTDPRQASMFTMSPWANRIERGKFATATNIHSIPANTDEPHPLHGHGWLAQWEVEDSTADSVSLRYEHTANAWAWPYRAMVRYRIEPDRLTVDLELENLGSDAMPTSVGFHPYFERPARLSATVDGRWLTDESLIPTVWEEADSFRLTDLDGIEADNTYTGWDGRAHLEKDGTRIEMVSDLKRLHLYAPRWGHFFALEPVSAAPDAANHPERGLVLLEPGERLHHWMRLVAEV